MENLSKMQDQTKPSMAGLITFCTATAFVLTILHVYALSIPLACNLLQYFTVDDYFKQAIQWLVPIVLSYGSGVVVERMMSTIREWLKDTTETKSAKVDTWIHRRFRTIIVISFLTWVLMPVFSWVIYYLGYSNAVKSMLYFGNEVCGIVIVTIIYIAYLEQHKDSLPLTIGDYKFVIYFVVLFMLVG